MVIVKLNYHQATMYSNLDEVRKEFKEYKGAKIILDEPTRVLVEVTKSLAQYESSETVVPDENGKYIWEYTEIA